MDWEDGFVDLLIWMNSGGGVGTSEAHCLKVMVQKVSLQNDVI